MSEAWVELSADYFTSLAQLSELLPAVSQNDMALCVAEFADFRRRHGLLPFTRYGEDKPSGRNRQGRLIALYARDNIHHCHLGIVEADPIVAYRILLPDHIVIVCVTTHTEMFKGDRRRFVRHYAAHFPQALRHRRRLRPTGRPGSGSFGR